MIYSNKNSRNKKDSDREKDIEKMGYYSYMWLKAVGNLSEGGGGLLSSKKSIIKKIILYFVLSVLNPFSLSLLIFLVSLLICNLIISVSLFSVTLYFLLPKKIN